MHETHLTRASLGRFLASGGDEEANRLLLHLLATCERCYAVGGYILDFFRAGALPLGFCSLDIELARSRHDAPELWGRLARFRPERRLGLVRDTKRFRSLGLVELLCEESIRAAAEDASQAAELAELACTVAFEIRDGEPIETTWLLELRAYAMAHLGNARRVLGELRSAARAFEKAEMLWDAGEADAGDALGYESRILDLKASLRRSQRRLPEALALLDQALAGQSDPKPMARLLVKKAKTLEEIGDLEAATAVLKEAALAAEAAADPRLRFIVRHNLVDYLTKADCYEEAERLLPECREIAPPGGIDRLRVRWTEGRIAYGLGRREEAVAILREVEAGFIAQRLGYDAALVTLELATIHAEAGEITEVRALAEQVVPLFTARDVHREALAALAMFEQAALSDTVSVERIRKCLRALRTAPPRERQGDPR